MRPVRLKLTHYLIAKYIPFWEALMQLRLSRLFVVIVLLFALLCPIVAQNGSSNDRPLLGFDRASSSTERALEARFDATLNPGDLRAWLKRLSARPHHLGSPYGKEDAEFIASQF